MSSHALLLSGSGRYADPWHPFAVTSERIAEVLDAAGIATTVTEDVDGALAALPRTAPPLLVVNIGAPDAPYPDGAEPDPVASTVDAASRAGLLAHLAAGRPLLALHVSSTSLPFVPEWEGILGGIWVRGTTMHPDYGRAHIHVETDAHPIVAGVHDFDVDDERYAFLRVAPGVRGLAWHDHDGARHPLLWTHRSGTARVVYDALGHDAASYDSPERRELLARSAHWLLGDL
jgi:type 1 glutamine amidotransferase